MPVSTGVRRVTFDAPEITAFAQFAAASWPICSRTVPSGRYTYSPMSLQSEASCCTEVPSRTVAIIDRLESFELPPAVPKSCPSASIQ